ncbi:EAL domain-containing protein [Cognaticolwellia mytili]|uniref:EAL domain-containing protein n=1 Tax=Cognaticolwellia mytili TaxID=1888913 RepID=UPI000A1787D5|nr:EAL domain-containing protein [Cognaticolwellia mytili]
MKGSKFFSIRYKLIILMVLVSIVVLSVAGLLFYKNNETILENSTIESARIQAAIVGSSLVSAIIFDDDTSAADTLALFSKNEYIEFAAVYLADGSKFSQFHPDPECSEHRSNANYLDENQTQLSKGLQKESMILGENYLESVDVITYQGQPLGYLYIRTSLEKLNQQRVYYRDILLYVIAFSVFLAGLLSTTSQRFITQPLNQMVHHVREISQSKDYKKRLDLKLNDELGTLAHGFNHMINVVDEREQELQNQSNNLQAIVDERTEQLSQKAHYDSLTLLPNRYLLSDRLEHAIATAKRNKDGLAVLFMDLDRFKIINDSLGHDVGDELLKAVAKRLKNIGRDIDTVARLGGDEFIYLAENIHKPEAAGRIAQKIHQAFEVPFVLNKHTLHVSTSIGICMYPTDGTESRQLLKSADVSMYHAKEQGPGHYSFYHNDMDVAIHERLTIENHLRNAITNNELYLVYQPQVNIESGEIEKVEALLRWNSSDLGAVAPANFIPVAEEIGIINQIGKWVIHEVCRQQQAWKNSDIRVAINISSSQLLDVDLVPYIKDITKYYEVNPKCLEFEITEEVFLEYSTRTIKVLTYLQGLGIKIAIDDFGTGYSSLRYLKELPVDTLKLDGMFVMDLAENNASRGIVSSTIILAHSLNMKIVAECVETQEQLSFLKQQNCDYAQGFHLHKPLSAEAMLAFL